MGCPRHVRLIVHQTHKYTHGRANTSLCDAAFNHAPTTTDGCLSSSPSVGSDISSRFSCPNTLPIPNTRRSDNSCPTTTTTCGPSRTPSVCHNMSVGCIIGANGLATVFYRNSKWTPGIARRAQSKTSSGWTIGEYVQR